MSGRISDFKVNVWLQDMQSGCYLALHYDNPDVSGAYASEIFGGGYTRQPINFSLPSNRAMWNITSATFNGMPPVTITHLGLWDVSANGNLLASIGLDTPIRVFTGKQISFASQEIAISVD